MLVAEKTSAAISWPLVSFDKVAIAQSDRGQRLKQRDYLAEGSIPVIDQGQALVGGYTDDENASFVGDLPVVLFGDHTRAVKLIHHRFAVGADGIKIFRPAEGVRVKYLYYWMKSARIPDRGYGRHYQYLRALSVLLPPEEQQDEIVAEIEKQFSRLDEAVANLQRVKANLKRYKASVLKDAVEGHLVPTEAELARREGRSFETGERLLQRILEARRKQWNGKGKFKEPAAPIVDGLPELPEGWAWARLDSVAALKGGITVDSKRADPTASMVPYLRVANVQRGYLDMTEIKQISAAAADLAELRLEFGDILFNEGGDRDKLGRGWIWENQVPDCIHQNHVFRARMFLPEMMPKLLSWWGNTFGKDYFQRMGSQTTNLASINLSKLSEFPVPIPPAAEQLRLVAEIERLLSVVDRVASEVEANLKRAQALRGAVLRRAFSTCT